MPGLSLLRRGHPLAEPAAQVAKLREPGPLPTFRDVVAAHGGALRTGKLRVLQVNVGKLCNQTCRHCHVDAGPDRREVMSRETLQHCLDAATFGDIPIVDVTGGAPEMNPHFRWFVAELRRAQRHVIDRCNLTILLAPGYDDLPEFLAAHRVEIVASLPCYLPANVERQRGDGVYEKSIAALQRLNALGYGRADSRLELTLVYNPVGPSLPPNQHKLEDDYRRELRARHGVEFTRLFALANMPIGRFLEDLLDAGRYEEYLQKLVDGFNPSAAERVMCRDTLSVGWDGRLFDCDFNQMLELESDCGRPTTIADFADRVWEGRPIVTARHCFGCTAGAGSSCTGAAVG